MSGNPILDRQIAESVQSYQQQMPQQMSQMPQQMPQMQQPFRLPTQTPPMPTQDFSYRPQVANPFFGGAIPMNFNLPTESQIPADYVARQYKPSMANPAPVAQPRFNNSMSQGGNNYLTGDSWNGGSQN